MHHIRVSAAQRVLLDLAVAATLVLAVTSMSCSTPVSPSGDVTVVSGAPATPATGAAISFYAQPVVLSVTNGGAASADEPVTVTFEVATDSAFNSIVASVDVPQMAGSQTSATLPMLSPDQRYFWRARSRAGTTTAPFTAAVSFTVGPRVTLGAPAIVQPTAGAFVSLRPTLVVTDVARTGPAGSIQYRFDVSTQPSFDPIVASGSVTEGAGQTSFVVPLDLAGGTAYVWRAQATDTTTHETGPTTTGAFVTPVVGAATLLIHIPTSCAAPDTDLSFPGTASADPTAGWSFASVGRTFSPLPLHLTLTVPVAGAGSFTGADYGDGSRGVATVLFGPSQPTTVIGATFGAGLVAGAFGTGQVFVGDQFDGPYCGAAGITWQVVPRS